MTERIKLLLVAGARPNFMKIAPVIREIQKRSDRFVHTLVHTGQHYDEGMSDVFFRDLGIPAPEHHLSVGSGSHAQQTAAIMTKFEPVLEQDKPACVLVFGDVNSTLACSIVAKKMGYPVAHVEAGLRSGDRSMPEEINRIVTDSISDLFFVTEESGLEHLAREGHNMSAVFHVGHVMIDNLFFELERLDIDAAQPLNDAKTFGLSDRFGVVTLHRPSNVDDEATLRGILGALGEIAKSLPLFFPVHPRTQACLNRFGIRMPSTVTVTAPLGYREFLKVWRKATLILTDSGGLQEESTALGIPCLTLRNNTERPATINEGTNVLVGTDPNLILAEARRILDKPPGEITTRRPRLWDGHASGRILNVFEERLNGAIA